MRTDHTDVAIIGGGIAGIAAGYYLTLEGASVTLLESHSLARGASGYAYGGIGQLGRSFDTGPNAPVAALSAKLHAELKDILTAETGIDVEYRTKPSVALAFTDSEADRLRATHAGTWAETSELLRLEPRINPNAIGGSVIEDVTNVHPQRFSLALARLAERQGMRILYRRADNVTRVNGRPSSVETSEGDVKSAQVVLACGPWLGAHSGWLGRDIPVRALKGQILRLQAPGPPLNVAIGWDKHYAQSKPDGLLWTGSTEEFDYEDESPTEAARVEIMGNVARMAPYASSARVAQQTACLRPVTPDGHLLLGPAPGWRGVYFATGGGRSGICLGPGIGRVTADLALGRTPSAPVDALTIDRFPSAAE